MSRTRVLVLWLVVGLRVGRPGPEASAGEIADDLSAVARRGPGGRGSVAARKATDRLSRKAWSCCPGCWRRWTPTTSWPPTGIGPSRADHPTGTRPGSVPEFPVSLLKTYVANPKRQGRVRRLVLDLVERLEPGTTDSLIPSLLSDPEFRDDAVAAALVPGGSGPRKAGRTREASGEYRKAFQAGTEFGPDRYRRRPAQGGWPGGQRCDPHGFCHQLVSAGPV
ncbi:MAG: hypothetical protein CM1200mP2_07740 [Planctomycetaceae bacterium]|nr:MAG: hypothetical protein CM1200mP2_07740 [Planctomycetaceae bacterium]